MEQIQHPVTAFLGETRIAAGTRADVTRAIEEGWPSDLGAILVFDDRTGKRTDLDYWDAPRPAAPAPGRPKLGVKAREITLLPRHWDWLAAQPGGASTTLRRLVEGAIKAGGDAPARRDAAYHFMSVIGGDWPGFEEAARALFREDGEGLDTAIAAWPADVRDHVARLLDA